MVYDYFLYQLLFPPHLQWYSAASWLGSERWLVLPWYTLSRASRSGSTGISPLHLSTWLNRRFGSQLWTFVDREQDLLGQLSGLQPGITVLGPSASHPGSRAHCLVPVSSPLVTFKEVSSLLKGIYYRHPHLNFWVLYEISATFCLVIALFPHSFLDILSLWLWGFIFSLLTHLLTTNPTLITFTRPSWWEW